jgi:hypothetical protein
MALTTDQKLKMLKMGLGVTGSFMVSKAQADQAKANQALNQQQLGQNAAQFRANTLRALMEGDRADQLQRSGAVLNSTRLGENENYLTRNRIMRALLPRIADAGSFTPGDPSVAAMMPKGGLPDLRGMVTPEMLQALSDEASTSAIANRQAMITNVDSSAPIADLQSMGLDADGSRSSMLETYANQRADEESSSKARMEDLIMQALQEDASTPRNGGKAPEGYEYDKKTGELKKKGSSVWKKIGKGAIIGGAALATAMTGGAASPALMAAIGAGAGAGVGAIDGGWKGALMGAGMGAATGGLGGGIGGAAGGAAGQAGKAAAMSMLKNPQFYMQTVGGAMGGPVGMGLSLGSGFAPNGQSFVRNDVNNISRRFSNRG